MTLVTASSRGQDISVGVAAAITSAVFVQVLLHASTITWMTITGRLLRQLRESVLLIGAFNGSLVADIQGSADGRDPDPVHGGSVDLVHDRRETFSPVLANELTSQLGGVMPGLPIQTPIILTAIFIVLVADIP